MRLAGDACLNIPLSQSFIVSDDGCELVVVNLCLTTSNEFCCGVGLFGMNGVNGWGEGDDKR